ncbi:ABC transporter permease (plasmid) [Priestia megaterium]|uniref:ABC transporter permease n=1 Tax=Priestia megaterium TaxID=1404 RepID=UPI0024528FF8|nr:ABC transporter permease subunit [Priestia megaterium]MDH3144404.1 ABC transporter permease subunit [Priestia megaterium]
MKKMLTETKSFKVKGISLLSVLVLLLIWTLLSTFKWVDPIFLPNPQSVWHSFISLIVEGYKGISLTTHVFTSLYRLLASLLIALVTAIPLGIICGYSKYILAIFDPIIEFYRPLPPLAYYALLVLWLGIDEGSKVALLFLSAFAPLFIATVASVQRVPKDRINGALTLGASKPNVFVHIILPSALPDIVTGLRTSIGITYATLVAAEMVAATSGIGWMVLDASKYMRSDIVFVGIIIMGLIAIFIDSVIRFYQRLAFSWVGK